LSIKFDKLSIQSLVRAIQTLNISKIVADPGFELHEGSGLPFVGTYRGTEGFLQFLEMFGQTFDIERLEPICSYESRDPDRIAFEFDLRATDRKTGQLFESPLIEIWKFKDGKVLGIKPHYFNSLVLQ
jgi:ketosteroid isomerase-like protein